MKIGIFFGGTSREREISFAGGRTVFDNLDKALFQPVPIFVDSLGQFILLDWHFIYKGTIRDFYPPVAALPPTTHDWQVYIESLGALSPEERAGAIAEVGRLVQAEELPRLMDFAFLALHGPGGEDGSIQGLLEWLGIPYSGSGILPSAFGIDKVAQKRLMEATELATPAFRVLTAEAFAYLSDPTAYLKALVQQLGLPLVIKAPHQGSSLGISILRTDDPAAFEAAVQKALFRQSVSRPEWTGRTEAAKVAWVRQLADIRDGIGLPVVAETRRAGHGGYASITDIPQATIHHPETLLDCLNRSFEDGADTVLLSSTSGETEVLIEQFVAGREFSCIVIENQHGEPLALPPTEIVKGEELFDYRSKYLPGLARKITPIDLPEEKIQEIRAACQQMFRTFGFQVYARLDGFYTPDGQIFLNDPNTTSGMLPASFFFHQAAEIGLNPSQFLTYLIRTSLVARQRGGLRPVQLKRQMQRLDEAIAARQHETTERIRVAVIMGGYSSERHISVESGRNIFEKLSSSAKYAPVPVFLTGSAQAHRLYVLPVNVITTLLTKTRHN